MALLKSFKSPSMLKINRSSSTYWSQEWIKVLNILDEILEEKLAEWEAEDKRAQCKEQILTILEFSVKVKLEVPFNSYDRLLGCLKTDDLEVIASALETLLHIVKKEFLSG